MTSELTLGTVTEILDAVGQILRDQGNRIDVVVIGGTALLLAGLTPKDHTTKDVDVVALGAPGNLTTAEPLPEALVKAADAVGKIYDLRTDWFNAGPTRQLEEGLPPGFSANMTTYDFAGLVIHVPGRQALIDLKVYAAIDSSISNKHAEDLAGMPDIQTDEVMTGGEWATSLQGRRTPKQRLAALIEELRKRQ